MARIAVTGARGRLGGQITSLLAAAGGHEVLGLTRAVADYDDRPALARALAGVDTLVLVSSDGEAELVLQHHLNIAAACTEAGVANVVALSSMDVDVDSPFCYARVNALTEAALAGTGTSVTAVRASIFTEFFGSLLDLATVDGALRLPAAEARVALVSREDVGRVMAACALAPEPAAYDVTGTAAVSMDELAAARGLTYVPIPEAEFAAHLAGRESPWWSYAYTSMFGSIREHRWESVSDTVERLTGHPPVPAMAADQRADQGAG
jgi:NAD(P)H dehydrogenase (quinone)